jgi:hypothetical protein
MKFIAYLMFVIGMLILYALPANRYEWVEEFDPSIPAGAFEDSSGNSFIFATLVSLFVVAAQIFLISKTKIKSQKIISVFMLVVVVSIWAFKFFP